MNDLLEQIGEVDANNALQELSSGRLTRPINLINNSTNLYKRLLSSIAGTPVGVKDFTKSSQVCLLGR